MPTEREYLAGLNPPLASMGRGRFSLAAKEALEKAKASGMIFDAPSYSVKNSPGRVSVAKAATDSPVPLVRVSPPRPVRTPQKRVRDLTFLRGRDVDGHIVVFNMCSTCHYHIQFCKCKAIGAPTDVVSISSDKYQGPVTYRKSSQTILRETLTPRA